MQNISNISLLIKDKSKELGFAACGFAQAAFLKEDAEFLKKWLSEQKHAGMHYMANHFDKRTDPRKLVENAKTIISLLHNYYPQEIQNPESNYRISKYAYGKDYHKILKNKLKQLFLYIQEIAEKKINGRYFVDSAPVLERRLAKNAGLGWIGKNTMHINQEMGSYTFLSEIIIDYEIEFNNQIETDHCGRCVACLKACPTGALSLQNPYQIDASKCISYHTIENKDEDKTNLKGNNNWIFGCDICQDVCPWNRKAPFNQEGKFNISDFIKNATNQDWEDLNEDLFEKYFTGTPLKRAKFNGIKRNIELIKN